MNWHVAIGLALIPPILLKIGSTLWRFGRYYLGDRRNVRAGPPHPVLRVLGPIVMISTTVLIVSGVALWLIGPQDSLLLQVHRLTFILWFIVAAAHLLAHVGRALPLAAPDSRAPRRGSGIPRARTRHLVVALSLVAGAVAVTVTTGWSHRGVYAPVATVLHLSSQPANHVTSTDWS